MLRKYGDVLSRLEFDTIPERGSQTDKRTDGQNCYINIARQHCCADVRRDNKTVVQYKEAIHIRKEGQQAMNRDEGSYQLSHAYDRLLDTASSRCVKNRKN